MKQHLIMIACMMLFYSCSEENNLVPVTDDPTIPGQVSNVRAERLPGAVKLTYDMPAGQNLSYVRAECTMKNGVVRKAVASSYINHLTVEGFSDASEYTVKLYSVNRSEKVSNPVSVKVQPLTPNFQEVFKKIQLVDDWGGASVFFENPNEADLAITIIHVDSTGFWNDGETLYTKRQKGQLAVRGLKSKPTKFGVFIRDRWNNVTDTLVEVLTPRFEKEIDRLKFKEVRLPSDAPYGGWGWVMPNIWNNILEAPGYVIANNGPLPQWMTMDLGVEKGALLSRFKLWNRAEIPELYYTGQSIQKFEVWGSMNPNPDGSWDDSWTLLLDEEVIKPSGLPLGQWTDEDYQLLKAGFEYTFPLNVPLVRYIRLKVKKTFGGNVDFLLIQLKYWGSEPDDLNQTN